MHNIYFCICKTICFAQVYVFAYAKVYTLYKHSLAYAKYIVLRMYMVLHAATVTLINWCQCNSALPRIAQCATFHCTFAYQKGDASAISEKEIQGQITTQSALRIRKSKE